jgi:alpha/beta superfamily hydrolase
VARLATAALAIAALAIALSSCGTSFLAETEETAPTTAADAADGGLDENATTATGQEPSDPAAPQAPGGSYPVVADRAALDTEVFLDGTDRTPAPTPPTGDLELVTYPAPLGDNVAYVTPMTSGEPKPAILWIGGGFDWGIGPFAWEPGTPDNDQSATVFRELGIATMYAALRGSNENPGSNECMLGEVDDLLAAAEYLRSRPDVDPDRVYLGGHSTGGTLALLAAESTDLFRAVFSFGPVSSPYYYRDACPLASFEDLENLVRSPISYIETITSPTWIIEGEDGNAPDVEALLSYRADAPVTAVLVPGADHFSVLYPGSTEVAGQILADTGPEVSITITAEAIAGRL